MSYRESHTTADYGQKYSESYRTGYNYMQWSRAELPLLKKILLELKQNADQRYLDFACGTGRILEVGESIFEDSTGYDISRPMLDEASAKLQHAKLLKIDISRQDIEEVFDVMTSFRFFTNAERELSVKILAALHGALSENGKFVVGFHRNGNGVLAKLCSLRGIKTVPGGPQFRDLDYAETLLKEAGFKIDAVHWYSFAPKISKYPDWMLKLLFGPVEKLISYLPSGMKGWSQCFLLVCSKQ